MSNRLIMNVKRRLGRRSRVRQRQFFTVESLEARALLTATAQTFNGPSLTPLIRLAMDGKNTAPAAINQMLQALEAQLESGPLADLTAGNVDGDGFVTEVQSLVASFEDNVDEQLLPRAPNIDQMLKL